MNDRAVRAAGKLLAENKDLKERIRELEEQYLEQKKQIAKLKAAISAYQTIRERQW